jgi:flagellar protein FlgJ
MGVKILLPLAATPPHRLPPAQVARIAQAARDFEAMALGQMLQPMFDAADTSKGLFGGGQGEAAFRPMLVNEIAKHMARHGGLGLARPVMTQMLRMREAAGSNRSVE